MSTTHTQKRRTIEQLNAAERQTAKRRYATITVAPLNSGSGTVYRNFKTREDFESFYRMWLPTPSGHPVPNRGVGGVGDGRLGISYRIYREDGL